MINYIEASLEAVVAHYIGSHHEQEDISYSQDLLTVEDEDLYNILFKYFLGHFKEPEFFHFTFQSGDLALNPMYSFVSNIFDDPTCLHEQSVKIARHLYEKSKHPNIKSGELYISYFKNILVDDELVNAVGIFKSENKDHFLKLDIGSPQFKIQSETGTNIGKLDKGCLIFETESDSGFKICNIDQSNKNKDAQYWRDEFLNIIPKVDDYHQTKDHINVTKKFIKERLHKEFDTDKTDEAAMMNRSFEYFKSQEKFDSAAYDIQVFKDDKVVDAFKEYKMEFQQNRSAPLIDEFDISDFAVKKQSRVFKSIIKLDKNFHIYVHGDQRKIQKGTDESGKKYYILYYDDES